MQFRDFRHQIEPDEAALANALEKAQHRFQDNLALLQLQQPELTKQLREFDLAPNTFCIDRHGDLNILAADALQLIWPPRAFEPDYQPLAQKLSTQSAAMLATPLHFSGANVLALLARNHAPLALIYVQELSELYASLHAYDWRPALKQTQLIFQIGESISAIEQDVETLTAHGIEAKPCTVLQTLPAPIEKESAWHFEQAMQWCHVCDPVLREVTHKYRSHHEFRLQNKLIAKVSEQPLRAHGPWTLFLIGITPQILRAALELPQLQRIVFISSQQTLARDSQELAQQLGITLETWHLSPERFGDDFVARLRALPPITAWMCRVYQGGVTSIDKRLRMLTELELRYWVQPQFGITRTLAWILHSQQLPQQFLTYRSQWPSHQGRPLPALILGNGPSLDATIEQLKLQPKAKVVVISCGSAIRTLANHHITPDIHLELELSSNQLIDLPSHFYEHVQFIAPCGFHAQTRYQFEHHGSVLLDNQVLDDMMPQAPDDALHIDHAFPTVVNLAVSLCAALRVEEIYLAGTDFAFESLDNHHAKGSHYDEQSTAHYTSASGELISIERNGRRLLTKREFLIAAEQLVAVIENQRTTAFYQLSEGIDLGTTFCKKLPQFDPFSQPKHLSNLACRQVRWRKKYAKLAVSKELFTLHEAGESAWLALLQSELTYAHLPAITENPFNLWIQPLLRTLAALYLRIPDAPLVDEGVKEILAALEQNLHVLEARI